MELITLQLSEFGPNDYNPNKMSVVAFEAEIDSICTNGYIDPITVREVDGAYEIVDGEHRHRALREIGRRIEAGSIKVVPCEYHPEKGWLTTDGEPLRRGYALPAVMKATKEVAVVNLGEISRAHAQRLTVILNNTRGDSDVVDLAALLKEIEEQIGDAVGVGMTYSDEEITDMLNMAEFDWDEYKKTREKSTGTDKEKWVTITARVTEGQKSIFDTAKRKLTETTELHKTEAIANGQALELLSAEYLAQP